ncbi:lipase/esterase family protein [Trichoderma arundinaceum]|uniref:Lipase/esterase family protein n=1 Tax=Trichoderma arundinaceum TaxID=490622 RepID=A0A395P4F7_TRIAR|nr:lipase/esterase family protein [Trichoderma arundinaceum]
MKVAIVLSFVATAMAGVRKRTDNGCNADNCARAVTGTRDGLLPITSRQSDCSSFMLATVTPAATTTTITITVDPEITPKAKRDVGNYDAVTVYPTAIPDYADPCEGVATYSSACSCWGITAATTTAAQPTKTEIVTVTQEYCEL